MEFAVLVTCEESSNKIAVSSFQEHGGFTIATPMITKSTFVFYNASPSKRRIGLSF